MSWTTTYELAEQHRTEMMDHAAEARLARSARTARKTDGHGLLRSLVARFARPATPPVVVAQVDTLPVPVEHTVAA